ncbi:MAG: hypothetical protein WD872_20405 [Pirellulaceae bacterium]
MIRTLLLASAVGLVFAAAPAPAEAFGPAYYGGYGPWGYPSVYHHGVGYVSPPPYYAVYPPVYYSPHITARHYGASPFAWPAGYSPGVFAPRVNIAAMNAAEPLMVANPYVNGADPAAAQARAKPKPLAIDNPFVAKN